MHEKCACVVLNYNDFLTTQILINKIKEFETIDYVVIVDNCSTDNSFEQLSRLSTDKIFCISTDHNGGYGAGNNYGIYYANSVLNCKYAILSNPDVTFDELYVKKCIDTLKQYDAACASGIQLDINGIAISDIAWKIPTSLQYAIMGTKLQEVLGCKYTEAEIGRSINEVECLPGALLVFDADKFVSVNGYDEKIFLYCEETALGIRLKSAEYKSYLLKEIFYIHEHSVSINKSISSEEKQYNLIFESRNYILEKYYNTSWIIKRLAKISQRHILKKRLMYERN